MDLRVAVECRARVDDTCLVHGHLVVHSLSSFVPDDCSDDGQNNQNARDGAPHDDLPQRLTTTVSAAVGVIVGVAAAVTS